MFFKILALTLPPIIEQAFDFPTETGQVAMIPRLLISKYVLGSEQILKVRFSMKLITEESEEIELFLPQSRINPHISFDTIENMTLELAAQRGIYAGKAFETLRKTFCAGLVAVTYPPFNEVDAHQSTTHMNNLFAMDDWVDTDHGTISSAQVKTSIIKKMAILNHIDGLTSTEDISAFVETLKVEQTPLTIAYAEEFVKQKTGMQKMGIKSTQFLDTIESYFQSVYQEKYREEKKTHPTESQNTEIRADASGALHALIIGASYAGIEVSTLEKRHYPLKNLKTYVTRCVEFSNDIYSLLKEHRVIASKYGGDLSKIRSAVAFNIVQILWQNKEGDLPTTLKQSLQESIKKHNDLVKSYYQDKNDLIEMLNTDKTALEEQFATDSGNISVRAAYSQLTQDTRQIHTYFQILEGWLAHGWWALAVPRYNLGVTLCTHERLLQLQALQK